MECIGREANFDALFTSRGIIVLNAGRGEQRRREENEQASLRTQVAVNQILIIVSRILPEKTARWGEPGLGEPSNGGLDGKWLFWGERQLSCVRYRSSLLPYDPRSNLTRIQVPRKALFARFLP